VGKLVLVCIGGALGSGARYLVATSIADAVGSQFPIGTLLVNVTGCFVIALVVGLSLRITGFPPGLRLFLTTGVMGGYTTYSSFDVETIRLVEAGAVSTAFVYVAATLAGGLLAGIAGLGVARVAVRAATGEPA
jgi:CrcB protein